MTLTAVKSGMNIKIVGRKEARGFGTTSVKQLFKNRIHIFPPLLMVQFEELFG